MPSVLSEHDKETVRRTIPKPSNKIEAVAVARLYVAYPNKQRWIYTGLQGAAVLANDLVGNTYWIKMVDVSGSNRGVIWDQEIYDPFYYNQDRTFFHSFELEECLAGLSFVDEKEAKQFKKKMDEREKNASKATKATPFQGLGPQPAGGNLTNGKSHHRFRGISNLLHGGQRSSSAPHSPPPPPQPQSTIPPQQVSELADTIASRDRASSLDTSDPSWSGTLEELKGMGITEDQIAENADFIRDYIEQRKASAGPIGGGADGATDGANNERRVKAPPPPPGVSLGRVESISPQHTGASSFSRRGPAPAPPQPRRTRPDSSSTASQRKSPSPPASPERTPSPPRPAFQFRAPPPIVDAGKFVNVPAPSLPKRPRATSNVTNPGLPPPPRPPKTPVEEENENKPKFGVPPPFRGERKASGAPPPPPSRAPLQPARTSKEPTHGHAVPPAAAAPPPLPPKTPNVPAPFSGPPAPPPLPSQRNPTAAPPPPPLPNVPRPVPSAPTTSDPPPPPPLPSGGPPPPLPPTSGALPPPPMPPGDSTPAPPLPPGRDSASAPALPNPTGGKEDVLASIRASGGIGGGRLKKVSDAEKRDRSAAMVPGAAPSAPSGASAPPAPSSGGGLGDALAAALSKRNKKVSASDDEDDNENDW